MNIIRAVCFFAIYPVTVRIGLSTTIQETIFQIWGGLRGAVAIALAISLNSQVIEVSGSAEGEQTVFEVQTAQLYQMVGGMSFMTLIVNGITAGPLLKKLGLVDEPETRKRIIGAYEYDYKVHSVDQMVKLLTYDTFQFVDFSVVRFHIPFLKNLTREGLAHSIRKMKQSTPPSEYRPPYLKRILPYLPPEDESIDETVKEANRKLLAEDPSTFEASPKGSLSYKARKIHRPEEHTKPTLDELRLVFLSLLESQYCQQLDSGELESNHPVTLALKFSHTSAVTHCKAGNPINDFYYLEKYEDSFVRTAQWLKKRILFLTCMEKVLGVRSNYPLREAGQTVYASQIESFIGAHKSAEKIFKDKFAFLNDELSDDGKTVVSESEDQVSQATASLKSKMDHTTVKITASHKFCKILLTKASKFVQDLNSNDMLKDAEAQTLLDEIEGLTFGISYCTLKKHDGEMSFKEDADEEQIEKENKMAEEAAVSADEASV